MSIKNEGCLKNVSKTILNVYVIVKSKRNDLKKRIDIKNDLIISKTIEDFLNDFQTLKRISKHLNEC